jgi:hypothetical protein
MLRSLVILAIAACGAEHGSSVPGRLNGMCLAGDVCNPGLVCSGGICVDDGESNVDGGKVPPKPPTDAPSPCADDSAFEPNDTTQTAFSTTIDSMASMSIGPVAICPASDVDHYSVSLSSTKNLEVVVSTPGGSPLSVSILNAPGTPIANGTATSPTSVRACAANLPSGTYFARVNAPGGPGSNYTITLRVDVGC